AGPTELRESLVFDNTSAFGGGVYLFNNNKLVLLRSEVSDNTASSDGGGVFGAGVILVESTVSDNTAGRDGAGLFIQEDDGPVGSTIINSTVAFNEAERHGGGLYLDFSGTLELFNVTVGFNVADRDGDNAGDGGGLFVDAGTVRPRHSIFGGNLDGSPGGVSAPDCSGPVESAGRNLFSSIDFAVCQTSGAFASDFVGSLGSPLDPGLEPCLENVGEGVFSTLALLDDSPAVDAGDPAGCLSVGGSTLEGDQLGNRRIWDGPDPDDIARCDLGAVELGAPSLTLIFRDGFESADLSAWSAVIQPSPARAPAPAWAPSTRAPAPSTLAERLRALVGPSRGGCPK
ncbi:MAG: choice-of-anchor Q domain-containing protein, partial [Acidobacteriota bacterium]